MVVLENVDKIVDKDGNELVVADAVASASSGSGVSIDMVATGALANGDIVGLRSDGTVEKVAEGTQPYTNSVGHPVVFESAYTSVTSATFDSNSNKVVIAYQDDGNSKYGTAVVGTVSENTITFGTPVVFESSHTEFISTTFDSNLNKVVIAYQDVQNSYHGAAIVGTVSGNTINFGTPVATLSGYASDISATFDSNSNKVVIAYRDSNNSEYGTAIVGTVSGDAISFGASVVFESANAQHISVTFDSNLNKVVIAYQDTGNSNHGTAVVGTVSGTTISFGTPVVFESSHTQYISATFDSNTNKVVIAYHDVGNNHYGTAVVGAVSGNAISFGAPVVFESATTYSISATFDSNTNKVVIAYNDQGNSNDGTAVLGTVSGNTITFGAPIIFESARTFEISATFDSNTNKVVIAYNDNDNSNGTAKVFQTEGTGVGTNADSWIGIAGEAINSGDSGKISVIGGAVDGLIGLTPNSKYYVNYDGTLTDTENAGPIAGTYGKVGRALTSTKLMITHGN